MKSFIRNRKTGRFITLLVFLFLQFNSLYSLPLTDTIYTIPEEDVEFFLKEEIADKNSLYRKDTFAMGFGILSDLSVWFVMDYLHNEPLFAEKSEVGDLFLKVRYYLDDYFNSKLHFAIQMQIRFPSGTNSYSSKEWRNLSLGCNEAEFSLNSRYSPVENIFLHFNLKYVFTQPPEEDFYGGFYGNIFSGDTYKKFFGLNVFAEDTFLSYERLKNDYFTLNFSINSDYFTPIIPFLEISWSRRIYWGDIENSDVEIQGVTIYPVIVSAGFRYFFTDEIYGGFYTIYTVNRYDDYMKVVYGIEFTSQF